MALLQATSKGLGVEWEVAGVPRGRGAWISLVVPFPQESRRAGEQRGQGLFLGSLQSPCSDRPSLSSRRNAISTPESHRLSNKDERVMSQALGPRTAVPDGSRDLQEE